MTNHKNRMSEIGFWAIPPRESPSRAAFDKKMVEFGKDPRVKKEIKKNWEKAQALILVQQQNGLGFPADKMLREYNADYNGRVLNGGLQDLPGSFNVVEAFQKFLPPSATFEIRSEIDNLFSFDSFIDYLTSDAADLSNDNIRSLTEDGVIYSYNSTSSPISLEFSTKSKKSYGFSSVSIVRFNNEISMILLAGRICNLEKETENIRRKFESMVRYSHRTHIQPDSDRTLRAEPLSEGSGLWKTIVLTRFDLDTKTMDVRYVYEDWGQSYNGLSDDRDSYVDSFGKFINEQAKTVYEKAEGRLNEYDAIFELCKTCLMLPKYFSAREEDLVVERHSTDFSEFRKKLSNSRYVSLVSASHQISHRNVNVLPRMERRPPNKSEFYAPNYKIETKGFWKRLSPSSIGRDKNDRPIHGRTWVSQIESWVEESDVSTVVTGTQVGPASENSGFIYVMRSAAHQKDIFKVGLTRRSAAVRASELTRTTGSPDQFLVVQEWQVRDCVLAEKLIHAKLQNYRINPNREFFMATYSVIRSAIDSVIDDLVV